MQAAALYAQAAASGDGEAAHRLGLMHDAGRGVPKDGHAAQRWYRKGAELGHLASQFNLAVSLEDGTGENLDRAEAIEWYRRAALRGDSNAQRNLGVNYRDGEGVDADSRGAYFWFSLASRAARHKPGLRHELVRLTIGLTLTGDLSELRKRLAAFEPSSEGMLSIQHAIDGGFGRSDRRLWESDP